MILQLVCESAGDKAIGRLSLVCRRWKEIVGDKQFRRRLHFKWLSTVYDWKNASKEFRDQYYVTYDIRECFGCNEKYKDVPGFMQQRGSLRFYSDSADATHPGYCSEFCARVSGPYSDMFDDQRRYLN